MISDAAVTVAFTGHRSYDGSCDEELYALVARLHSCGFTRFLCGMAAGFDLAAAEAVLKYRVAGNPVALICVLPFPRQAERFSFCLRSRYDAALYAADDVTMVCEDYDSRCYHMRNDRLVEGSSLMVAYYDGSEGGTRYTVRRAIKAGHEIINLYSDPQHKIPFR